MSVETLSRKELCSVVPVGNRYLKPWFRNISVIPVDIPVVMILSSVGIVGKSLGITDQMEKIMCQDYPRKVIFLSTTLYV